MKNSNLCTCKDAARLESPVELYCGRCGGRLLSDENTRQAYELIQKIVDGSPTSLPEGSLRIAAGAAFHTSDQSSSDISRREFIKASLISFGFGVLAGALSQPLGTMLGITTGITEDDEIFRMKVRNQVLTENDIDTVESALLNFDDLYTLASQYRIENRHAVAKLLEALSGHILGVTPQLSIKFLTNLLEGNHPTAVKRYLYLRRAKVQALIGDAEQGLNDLEQAISLTSENEKQLRAKLFRQAMNHAYICIQPNDILEPPRWSRLRQYLKNALEIMELDVSSEVPILTRRAIDFEPTIGAGVLIFEAITRAIERYESKSECREILQWHFDLISVMQQYDAITGWNQYSRLAAHAIAIGHLDFAQMVLVHASQYAFSNSNDKVSQYARQQRLNQGSEWLLHKVVLAALHIDKHKRVTHLKDRDRELQKAREALREPLDRENAIKAHFLLRAAKLYELETLSPKDKKQRIDAYVGAFSSEAWTHWTYFQNIPQGNDFVA